MADIPSLAKSPTLQPPRKSVELEDPGAHELGSDNEEDVFADAQEGQKTSSDAGTAPQSPIPITRVEKVDNKDSYGDIPGTEAYDMRAQDAIPDELEVIPETAAHRPSMSNQDSATGSIGITIPKTVVETVDPINSGHGNFWGQAAHSTHRADAVPNVVMQAPNSTQNSSHPSATSSVLKEPPVPKTVVTKVDGKPSHGEVPGTEAHEIRKADAEPDAIEKKGDVSGLTTSSLSRSTIPTPKRRKQSLGGSPIAADGGFGPMDYEESPESSGDTSGDIDPANMEGEVNEEDVEEAEEGFGDDFDDFEAGAEGDDFGEFDEGFRESGEPQRETAKHVEPDPPSPSPFPLLDFASLDSLDSLVNAISPQLNAIFPSTTKDLPPPPEIPPSSANPIFLTPRSTSLYTQLSAPPTLQPPNWLRSRIRRLFLVSLGVPVDLDEILPASKQKKLVLPSTTGGRLRGDSPRSSTLDRLKQNPNASRTSLDAPGSRTASPSTSSKKRRTQRSPAPPPNLSLSETRNLCSTTEAALNGMDDEELRAHVQRLEEVTHRASEVLEYWLRRKDEGMREKEAFEGVIENLVRHARRIRK